MELGHLMRLNFIITTISNITQTFRLEHQDKSLLSYLTQVATHYGYHPQTVQNVPSTHQNLTLTNQLLTHHILKDIKFFMAKETYQDH